ncbi:MAG TPA: hypothetical protein VM345_05765 [Acidimicrobiales bacterium]|nr:hypothetical protein [Acidimicrobiales bacterium]
MHDAPLVEHADEAEELNVEARPAPPQGIGGLSLSELWQAATRYKPVAVVVVALAVIAVVAPGAQVLDDAIDEPSIAASLPPTAVTSSAVGDDAPSTTVADETSFTYTGPADVITAIGMSSDDTASFAATASSGGSDAAGPSGSSRSGSSSSSSAVASSPSTSVSAALAPSYTVREGGWATAGSSSPLSGAGVPEGGLPVGKRLGDTDKISFVRLGGASKALVLNVSTATGANRFPDAAKVRACRILSPSWEAKPAQSFDAAPPYDRNACSIGEAQADGTWRFDLDGFSDAADARGFALVPADDAGSDFQLVFTTT